jgi:H+/gluconate symporter-like permease
VSQNVHFTESSTPGTLLNLGKAGLEWIGLEAVGGVVLGIPSAILAYFLCLWAVVKYRTTQLNRRIELMRARVHEAQVETDQKTPAHAGPEKADDVPPPAGESKA